MCLKLKVITGGGYSTSHFSKKAEKLSCEKFSLCKSGEWKISHCNEGLVHLPESGGNFLKQKLNLHQIKISAVCAQ